MNATLVLVFHGTYIFEIHDPQNFVLFGSGTLPRYLILAIYNLLIKQLYRNDELHKVNEESVNTKSS